MLQSTLVTVESFGVVNFGNCAQPAHRVRISKPFYIGVYEVTQKDYLDVMGSNPSYFQPGTDGAKDLEFAARNFSQPYRKIARTRTDFHPVEQISWLDAVEFCRLLSKRENRSYRLPTEAEWEYACRAGTEGWFFWGDGDGDEYCFGSGQTTGPVGRLTPNDFGLYDTSGNVREFVSDIFTDTYYAVSPSVDPKGPSGESRLKAIRGGNFTTFAWESRASWGRGSVSDNRASNNAGFRVVLELSAEELVRFGGTHDERASLSLIPDLSAIRRAEDRDDVAMEKLEAGNYLEAIGMDPRLALKTDAWIKWNFDSLKLYENGVKRQSAGQYHQAIASFLDATKVDPKAMWASNNLAWLLSTCREPHIRDGWGAVPYAIAACEASHWQYWGFVETLGCALAEAGEYDKAIECCELAKRLAIGAHKTEFAEEEKVWQMNVERAKRKQRPIAKVDDAKRLDGD